MDLHQSNTGPVHLIFVCPGHTCCSPVSLGGMGGRIVSSRARFESDFPRFCPVPSALPSSRRLVNLFAYIFAGTMKVHFPKSGERFKPKKPSKTRTEVIRDNMHPSMFLLALLVSIASGHRIIGDRSSGLVKVMGGRRFRRDLDNRMTFEHAPAREIEFGPLEVRSPTLEDMPTKIPRAQSCGAGAGSCPAGYCCSSNG